jgi:hypothetical protein
MNLSEHRQYSPFPPEGEAQLSDDVLVAVGQMISQERARGDSPSLIDQDLLDRAHSVLEDGARLPSAFCAYARPRQRSHQTLLAITNAGPCHLTLTSREQSLLEGVLVHVEHIDRSDASHPTAVEPYRVPEPVLAAKVRLHIGDAAPCSVYVGAPTFVNGFEDGFLKAINTIAAACTAFFLLGYSECKVSCVGLRASEAVRVMKSLAKLTLRVRQSQVLSAAFNLNTPLVDDLRQGPMIEFTAAADIAKYSIELVKQGGFDKVTWDSAGKAVPSCCVFELLSHRALVQLTHKAHSCGLETYVSGGVSVQNVQLGVYAGVGGIGIGTSLHSVDEQGRVGDLIRNRVSAVIGRRNQAEASTLGLAAQLLAKADWDYASAIETTLTRHRDQLVEFLSEQDGAAAAHIVTTILNNTRGKNGV